MAGPTEPARRKLVVVETIDDLDAAVSEVEDDGWEIAEVRPVHGGYLALLQAYPDEP